MAVTENRDGLLVGEPYGIVNDLLFEVMAGTAPGLMEGRGLTITVIGLLSELIIPPIVDLAVYTPASVTVKVCPVVGSNVVPLYQVIFPLKLEVNVVELPAQMASVPLFSHNSNVRVPLLFVSPSVKLYFEPPAHNPI
jgi:hypothetical protein